MPVKKEQDLAPSLRQLWSKAAEAIELQNFGYAISLLRAILKQEPEFLIGRQLLRRTERSKNKLQKKTSFLIPASAIWIMKAQRQLKKDPRRAVEMIEEILEHEPSNRQANLVLKEAALAAGWPVVAVFALQTLLEEDANDSSVLHELGELYRQLGETDKEVQAYNRIMQLVPSDSVAARLYKDALANASIKASGWNQAQSYDNLIKNNEAADSSDQDDRLVMNPESLDEQIRETLARHQSDARSVTLARRLGDLYGLKEDLENAFAWYQYAGDLTNHSDASLTQKISDLSKKCLDREIAEHERFLATHGPEEPLIGERSEMLILAKKRRVELLLNDARRRRDLNPADHELLLDLGEQLFHAGQFREALPELQQARQNPSTRLKAMSLLGRCYRELGMLDLAAQQFEKAAEEIQPTDAMRKEILYNLGLVYELLGEGDKSIATMKQIYEVEYGYRDVAYRVESSYAKQPQEGGAAEASKADSGR